MVFNSDEAMWVEQPFENIRNSVVFDHKNLGIIALRNGNREHIFQVGVTLLRSIN